MPIIDRLRYTPSFAIFQNVLEILIMAPRKQGRPRLKSAPAVLRSPIKKKRKQWSNESMIGSLRGS